ncbi:MAG: twin-arginine translocase subunit TatC [Trueperaceae bacterium]|nr:twin-arginine translocase subunit TatC [Trueperaceae bacterium]
MTLIDHLSELRNRLFIAILAWVIGASVAFYFQSDLLAWLKEPLPDSFGSLFATQLLEPFLVSMQIAAFFGLVLSSPIIFGQIWGFISPGLYKEERRWAVPFVLFTFLAFAGGVLFAYYVVLPLALPIIMGFLSGEVILMPRIGDYISKILLYMAVFGILFEMPVVGFLFARLGLIYSKVLTKFRRYSIVVGLVLAAVLTPTADPFNFALVAIPLVILYEITIIVVRLAQRRVPTNEEHALP